MYLLLVAGTFLAMYLAVVQRKAEATAAFFAFVLSAMVSGASWNIEVASAGSQYIYQSDGLGLFFMGLTLLNLAYGVLSVLDMLPETEQTSLERLEKEGYP